MVESNGTHTQGIILTLSIICNRPESFKSAMVEESNGTSASQQENEVEDSDDDGLPPLEANTNRLRPFELEADGDSESSSDTDD